MAPISNPKAPSKPPTAAAKQLSPINLVIGAGVSLFEVTTLGQPFEVLKTQMAAARGDTLRDAIRHVWARGGVKGFYQGLIPWAWIESGFAGAILLFTAAELEHVCVSTFNLSPSTAGLVGGCGGGVAQAYGVMGVATCMKTAEITRQREAKAGQKPPGTMAVFMDIYRREGIRGINKGVNAVAIRQCTNWGSRMGFARLAEDSIRSTKGKPAGSSLTAGEKVSSSVVGGVLGCWNHPIEVVRVEMQSMAKGDNPNRPAKLTIANTFAYIYKENGMKGLFKGVTPRVALSTWRTICFVAGADWVKTWYNKRQSS